MGYKSFIVTNFAYGTGPYLRATELAIAVNECLEKGGHKRLGIIVPLVYGTKQKKIMREEFGDFYKSHPKEIILDEKLGRYLKKIFYGDETYEQYLHRWLDKVDEVSGAISSYLIHAYGENIVMELHRSPRVLYNVAPSYFVSFVYIAKVYEEALGNKEIAVSDDLLRKAIPKIKSIEESHLMHFITEPGTFSCKSKGNIPPTIDMPDRDGTGERGRGLFVTVTGIPGLERLYEEAKEIGLSVYSNDTKAVPFATYAPPHIIGSSNILFQFARSGWSSVWLSMLSGSAIVVPEWDKYDDPEIYFNNICIEKLGLGIVYRGQPLDELLKEIKQLGTKIEECNKSLYQKFGTEDGTRYCAERISADFLKNFEFAPKNKCND